MKFFFEPENVALVGATEKHGPGRSLHKNLSISLGDRYFPVHPRGGEIKGFGELDSHKVYKSLSEVPGSVELVVIFIPAKNIPAVVEECGKKGVKGIIIQAAGFSEVGPEGEELQNRVVDIARSSGIRVWGPNCMGMINGHKGYVMSFMSRGMFKDKLIPGDISLVVQSGMLSAGFLASALGRVKFGLSKVCSIGNKADVDELDILEYLVDDPETGVIAMYLESINNGRRFMEIARGTDKPIVMLKGGDSEGGAKAAISHTASIAGNTRIVDAALKQANVIRVEGMYELLDVTRVLSQFGRRAKHPAGIAILTFSGAAGIVTTDMVERMGMKLAAFAPETIEKLKPVYPEWMPPDNPADLYPAIELNGPAKAYLEALRAVLEDPNVDGVIIHLFALPIQLMGPTLDEWAPLVKKYNKPVLTWLMGDPQIIMDNTREMESRGFPIAPDLRSAATTLAAVFSGK